MSVLLAVCAAGAFGVGDFLGGLATRRAPSVFPVVAVSHVVGLTVAGALVLVFSSVISVGAVLGGALGGVTGAAGIALLYRGLAVGRMAVVAPITAVGAAVLPLAWGLATGERPSTLATAGALVGIISIPIVAAAPGVGSPRGRRGVPEAIGSGVGFALFFIAMDATGPNSGAIPLLAARVASVPLFVGLTLARGSSLRLPGEALRPTLAAGALDVIANGFFLAATREGFLALAAVVSSLYPAVTIVLARAVLDERIARPQTGGLALAGVGVVLMVLG